MADDDAPALEGFKVAPQDDDRVIRTKGLTKRYGDLVAVDGLDLVVHRGEVFGLLGPNGAGKTTTILMLLGLSEPTKGKARVLGYDPTRQPLEIKRRVGYMPDNVGFYGDLTGRQNLTYTARLNGLRSKQADERIDSLLDLVGLADVAGRRVETYSRGMRQRLGVADALVKEPSVLILDEPTVAIDPEGVMDMLALIRSLAHEHGVTILLSSHLLHQVESVCDRVGIFAKGKMVAVGRMSELAQRILEGPVILEVGSDSSDEVETLLRSQPGVTRVVRDAQEPRLWLVSSHSDSRHHLAAALVAVGKPVWHLRVQGTELDQIYLRYFQEDATSGSVKTLGAS
jgi:ABC-2 type transport system ATP-binding protein